MADSSWLGFVVLACLAGACGGKVEGSDETTDPGGQTTSDGAAKKPGSGEALGECKLGPKAPSTPCAWIGDGRCYSAKNEACNCICPRDHDSVCWSDFPSGTSPVVVYCD